MDTPICDFLERYASGDRVRMHMPGHKGVTTLGRLDITEVSGADSLYEASGIIEKSEKNASLIFGASTYYSTEGSSLCIRAMVQLICSYARAHGRAARILAARNVHKSFVSAVALTGCEVDWLYGGGSYLSCDITADSLREALLSQSELPTAVYITSPDYLGHMCDVRAIADVCREHGVLLAVDNAHGSYLKFLEPSLHPMDLGAHMCSDSAHKTLPALTGAAYLHISNDAPSELKDGAKRAMSLFASTSPSYLLLRSLDELNATLSNDFRAKLSTTVVKIADFKQKINDLGYEIYECEPMKITVLPKSLGYTGTELLHLLSERGIEAEFADADHLVLMPSPYNADEDLDRLYDALACVLRREPICVPMPDVARAARVMSVRDALLSPSTEIAACDSAGRILADVSVGCPPAVPILISGEIIEAAHISVFEYYGIHTVSVVRE